jgi:large subunit ribosomal protein L15
MKLSELPRMSEKRKKRIGRGHGSGRGGHTSTRGNKGQRSRGKIALMFEGTKIKKSLLKRLPLFRGKGKFKSRQPETLIINLKYLNVFGKNEEVTLESLKAKGILAQDQPIRKIKILGDGEIGVPLKIFLPVSKAAKEKIEKAGGQVMTMKEEK